MLRNFAPKIYSPQVETFTTRDEMCRSEMIPVAYHSWDPQPPGRGNSDS